MSGHIHQADTVWSVVVHGVELQSAKPEGKCLCTAIEELDLELSIGDGVGLPNQLIHGRFGEGA